MCVCVRLPALLNHSASEPAYQSQFDVNHNVAYLILAKMHLTGVANFSFHFFLPLPFDL
jgi:hypothetical protein